MCKDSQYSRDRLTWHIFQASSTVDVPAKSVSLSPADDFELLRLEFLVASANINWESVFNTLWKSQIIVHARAGE